VNGESSINSIVGVIVTLFIFITVSGFALYRFQVMVSYGDTSVTEVEYANVLDSHFTFDFEQENFKIAFGLTPTD